MRFMKDLYARLCLVLIYRKKRNGNLAGQRRRLDKFLERHAYDYPFTLAYDAMLMLAEERYTDAIARLRQCESSLPDDDTPDTRYVRHFCRFVDALNSEDSDSDWQKIRRSALNLEVDPLIKFFVSFPSEERMSEIVRKAGRPVVFIDVSLQI